MIGRLNVPIANHGIKPSTDVVSALAEKFENARTI
jgi:hypothetical protein